MSSQDDLSMLWYGVSGVSFNPADPAEVLLNTGTAAPLLSDHPRPLVATPSAQAIPNSLQQTATYATSLSHHNQLLYDSNTGDYISPEYIYETVDGYEEQSNLSGIGANVNSQLCLSQKFNSEDDTSAKTKKPKVHQNPALKLKTPIAYQKDTDISAIPIMKEGMAVCKRCGAIGVKHAFYGKERKFCSLACARPPQMNNCIAKTSFENANAEIETDQQDPEQIKSEVFVSSGLEICANDVPPDLIPVDEASILKKTIDFSDSDFQNSLHTNLPRANPSYLAPYDKKSSFFNSFDWESSYLGEEFSAIPANCFKHSPMAECWEHISAGMKVEVSCRDESLMEDSFWVATVIRIEGYKAKLRYEGFVDDSSKDFWVDLCSEEVHPVGWCATQEKSLIPPKSIQFKYKNWKEFLMRRLTGARTLPTNFHSRIVESQKSRFRPGLNLEVVDKNRIAQMRVATVTEVVGKRLHLRYHGASPDDNGFWCHEDAAIIHPVGWSREIGHEIVASQSYHEKCMNISYDPDDASPDLFLSPSSSAIHTPASFSVGMKLEAIDPLNLSTICVATVMKILAHNYIMIRIDSYENDNTCSDWFCYHSSSPCLFPAGFCEYNNIDLTPPKGYEGHFSWFNYLNKTQATAAPPTLFSRVVPDHDFEAGMHLEAADLMDPRLVCVASVKEVKGRLLRIHFDGWEDEFDQWVDCYSPDIYPVGWCKMVGYKLEGPKENFPQHIPKKKNKVFGPRKGRSFGRRGGGFNRGVENASPTPSNPASFHHWRRGRKPRSRGSASNRLQSHGINQNEVEEYSFNSGYDSPDLSIHNERRRGRPKKMPLSNSNRVNSKLKSSLEMRQQQTHSSYMTSEDDGASDETSSGVASLADSDTSADCWDISDSIVNSASLSQNIEETPSPSTSEPFSNSLKSDGSLGDFFIKASDDFGETLLKQSGNPVSILPENSIDRECNTPTFCDSPANFLMDNQVDSDSKIKLEESSFQLSSSLCTNTNFIDDKETIDFFGDQVSNQLPVPELSASSGTCEGVLSESVSQVYRSHSQSLSTGVSLNSSSGVNLAPMQSDNQQHLASTVNCQQSVHYEVKQEQLDESLGVPQLQNSQVIGEVNNFASAKFIPRIIDSSYVSKGEKIEPRLWSSQDVASFLQMNDCAAYCDNFITKQINGSALLKLSQMEVMGLTGMKVGPSLKIHDLIQQLLALVNPAQARHQATLLRRGITTFGRT